MGVIGVYQRGDMCDGGDRGDEGDEVGRADGADWVDEFDGAEGGVKRRKRRRRRKCHQSMRDDKQTKERLIYSLRRQGPHLTSSSKWDGEPDYSLCSQRVLES